jgi:hypothetical protein
MLRTHKRTLRFLITIMILITLLVIWIYTVTSNDLKSSIFLLFLFFVIIAFVLNNYFNYLRFFIYQHKLSKGNILFTYDKCTVEMHPSSYKTTPLMKNNEIIIEIPPYNIECNYIQTAEFFALFCKISYFSGLCKRDIAPILIKFDNNTRNSLGIGKRRVVVFSDTYFEGDTLVISPSKKIKDIKKLKVVDFKNFVSIYERHVPHTR